MRGFSRLCTYRRRVSWTSSTAKVNESSNVDYCRLSIRYFHGTSVSTRYLQKHFTQPLCTNVETNFPWGSSSFETFSRKLEICLEDNSIDEAWEAFNNFKCLHGFPHYQLISKLIVSSSYTSNIHWLRRAYALVTTILKEKPTLLHPDSLTRLALALARAQLPVPASTIIRVILEKYKIPSNDILSTLFSHMVQTETGSYLASDIMIEICEYCLCHRQVKLMNLSTTMFNLVLDSCVRFGSILKAQRIIELMSSTRVLADANSIVTIARIFEMTGQRDELNKLKVHIYGASSVTLNRHYRQFYDCLLSLHFKYNDLDAAAELMLDLYRLSKNLSSSNVLSKNPCILQIGSNNLNMGFKIIVDPKLLLTDFVVSPQARSGLVHFIDGKLVPSNKAIAKLVHGYVKEKKVHTLSNLLVNIEKETEQKEASLSSDVMVSCIKLGWLETAHDILDGLESAKIPVRASSYEYLLRAYYRANMLEESKVLLKQMRRAGFFVNLCDDKVISSCLCEDGTFSRHDTSLSLEVESSCPLVYELNNSILFFCKAKMMEDALRTYKLMAKKNVQPTVMTFSHLVNGYSSMQEYRQITIWWGEIRRKMEDGLLLADRDLFECLLWNFITGGYFERVMEIVDYMAKHNMYTDKWKYKRWFLKKHKGLYRNLKLSDARTDAQSKRLEHVRAFRKWVGITR